MEVKYLIFSQWFHLNLLSEKLEWRTAGKWQRLAAPLSSLDNSFPLDLVLRVDSLMAMIMGFSVLPGCRQRICLVAVTGTSVNETICIGSERVKEIGAFDAKNSLNNGYVAGMLTVDTVADYLPRKGHLRQRRTGIAYISNVAVRESFRRKGIAKRLIWKAEALAKNWGC
ncbi:hypothetical protein N665_7237s0001 [Sinapis alba]|nr:hypothetical protein N665_7237s0001 [Sinapis alba]